MRVFILIAAISGLAATLLAGCGNQDTRREPPARETRGPETASRVNLYPLTAPPPGANQPLPGYAPTRITTTPYDTAVYADASGTVPHRNVAYGPGNPDPFGGNYGGSPFAGPAGYCTVEEVTRFSSPTVPIGPPPVVVHASGRPMTQDTAGLISGPGGRLYGPVEGTADIAVPMNRVASYTPPAVYAPVAQPAPVTPYSPPPVVPVTTINYGQPALQTPPVYAAPPSQGGAYYPPPAAAPAYPPPAVYAPPLSSIRQTPAPAPGSGLPYSSPSQPAPVGSFSGGNVSAIKLIPAPDIPPGNRPNDALPSQWFEVMRPGNGPIRIGRVSSTCVCVGVRVPERQVPAGARALIEARILTRPPVNNLTYGIYVDIIEPEKTVVDADVTIRW